MHKSFSVPPVKFAFSVTSTAPLIPSNAPDDNPHFWAADHIEKALTPDTKYPDDIHYRDWLFGLMGIRPFIPSETSHDHISFQHSWAPVIIGIRSLEEDFEKLFDAPPFSFFNTRRPKMRQFFQLNQYLNKRRKKLPFFVTKRMLTYDENALKFVAAECPKIIEGITGLYKYRIPEPVRIAQILGFRSKCDLLIS